MFIDQAKIKTVAGAGGRGCNSFYRDKFQREGIPDGGDGGNGADIIVRADRNLRTLLDLQYHREFRGASGEHGAGKHRRGKDAEPIIIRVPCGTIVKDFTSGAVLRDLDENGEEIIVVHGGRGGRGNRFRTDPSPGQEGQSRELVLDLKLIADIGVVGFPNAGKSTLISSISNAHPDIAAYPFTTKSPVLGVVGKGQDSFVIADIPGLIEGSSEGRGLGDRFLRHIERTELLVHLIDMGALEGRDPVDDYKAINKELKNYSIEVFGKPQIIVANKMDLPNAKKNLKHFKEIVKKKVIPISALAKEGMEELIEAIRKKI